MSTSHSENVAPTTASQGATPTGKRVAQSLGAGIVCVGLLMILQRGIGLGRSLIICDWLPDGALGEWELSFSFLMAVGPLMVLGIPGAFGRFAEGYRQRKQIGRFIAVTSVACGTVYAISMLGLFLGRDIATTVFFGAGRDNGWLWAILPALASVVVFNYTTSMLSALRLHTEFARCQATQGVGFAVLCLLCVPASDYTAGGVIVAYALASLITSSLAALYLWQCTREETAPRLDGPGLSFVAELVQVMRAILPMAVAVWLATFIANTFLVTDRALIMNLAEGEEIALFFVAQYHVAGILARLMEQFAMTLAAVITPHLAEDWDRGEKELASQRLSSLLKLISLLFCTASIPVVIIAPWLLDWIGDRFELAVKLLPWTLATSITLGLAYVFQNAFWCTKRTWWTSVAFLVGLGLNVALGIALFPILNVYGVVISTYLSMAATFVVMLSAARGLGFRFPFSTYLLLALPGALTLGYLGCCVVLILLVHLALVPSMYAIQRERDYLRELVRRRFGRLTS
ncbi:MAG: hypothetical protein AAFU85_04855 [Planctomycetota bacterium]